MATATRKKKKPSQRTESGRKGPTFKKVWALMQENAERQKETDRIIRESAERFEREKKEKEEQFEREKKEKEEQFEREKKEKEEQFKREKKERDEKFEQQVQEANRKIKEVREELKITDRIVRRNGKQMGELHRRFGQLAEHLVAPGIAKRFNELGYGFDAMAPKGQKIFDAKTGKIKAEIDLILENGKTIMVVEVKVKPVIQDIEHHIRRLEILRDHRRGINDLRKVQGAVAGAIYEDDVKKAVREAGMYVIEQSGDTMKIDMPDGFIPREW